MTQENQLKADMRTWHEMAREAAQDKLKDFQAALEQSRMQTSDDTLWSDETETINMPELLQKQAYQEYQTLCKNGGVQPMSYEEWVEWDRDVYQKHVREAANPLTPDTFQRLQEADLTEGKELDELRDMYQGIVEENESLVVDLAEADRTTDALVKERDTYRSMANELNTKVGELQIRKEELIQSLEQAILAKSQAEAETTRIGRLNNELRTQLQSKDKEVSDLVALCDSNHDAYEESVQKNSSLYDKVADLEAEFDRLCDENTTLISRNIELHNELKSRPFPTTPENYSEYPHYFRPTPNATHIDVNWFLKAFSVPCCEGHAIKKLAVAGQRGVKDRLQDLEEARNSINRAIELEQTK